MPSIRPSQYAMQQPSDGGPFLRFEREDLEGDAEEEFEPIESDDGFEMTRDDIYGMSRVYYSDVELSDADSPDWHLILEVTPDDLTIYPIYPRSGHIQYGEPKYETIKSIIITSPVYQPYAHPSDRYEVEYASGHLVLRN